MPQRLPPQVWVAHVFAYCTLAEICRIGRCSTELHTCATDPNVQVRIKLVILSTSTPVQTDGLLGRFRVLASGWMPGNHHGSRADRSQIESLGSSEGVSSSSVTIGSSAADSMVCTGLAPAGLRALVRDGRQALQVIDIDGGLQMPSGRRSGQVPLENSLDACIASTCDLIPSCTRLKSLSLCGLPSALAVPAVAPVALGGIVQARLLSLDLRANGLGSMDAVLWHLLTASGRDCPPLRELDLADNDVFPHAVPFIPSAFPLLTRLGLGGAREAVVSFYVGSRGRGGNRGPRSSSLSGDAAATVLRALAGAAGISLSMSQARATAEDLTARRLPHNALEPSVDTTERRAVENDVEEVRFSWEGFSRCRVDLFEGVFETGGELNRSSTAGETTRADTTSAAADPASNLEPSETSATVQLFRLNLRARLPSRVQLSCGVCGEVLVPSVGPPFARGSPTQPHIGFEFYFNQDPDPTTTESFDSANLNDTALNCRRPECHGNRDLFLLARSDGPFVDTKGFRWAAACGPGLVHATVLDDDDGDLNPGFD